MKKFVITVAVLACISGAQCSGGKPVNTENQNNNSSNGNNGNNSVKSEMPAEFRRSGMITSSTYQVFITVFGNSEQEAQKNGLQEARQKAYNLLLQEPFIPRNISDEGKRDLRRLIEESGKMVQMVKESDNTWSLVLQINKPGLRNYLQQMR